MKQFVTQKFMECWRLCS